MALHVTQCPSCESTFNTSAAMLETAAGKVRCGACLTVFEAIDNFVDSHPAEESQDAESVFVGNNPQDYFDPGKFLTRSALQQDEESPEEIEQLKEPIEEDPLALSDQYTKEFFDAVEQNMEESLNKAESEKDSFFDDIQAPLLSESESMSSEMIPDSSEKLDEPVTQETNNSDEAISSQEHKLNDFDEEPEPAAEEQFTEVSDDFSAHTITETEVPAAPQDLFPESVREHSDADMPSVDDFVAQSITEIVPPGEDEDSHIPTKIEAAMEEESTHQTVSGKSSASSKPEDLQLSVSFTMQRGTGDSEPAEEANSLPEKNPESTDSADQEIDAEQLEEGTRAQEAENLLDEAAKQDDTETAIHNLEAASETDTSIDPYDQEDEINQEIAEHDFKESIADGIAGSASEFEEALFGDATKSISQEKEKKQESGDIPEKDDLDDVTSATEEEFENPEQEEQVKQETQEEDNTEIIRARALEAELNDEAALESIPEENIAALDVSSTPVELIAGVQRKYGRQILLGISILLLGGGLGSQYLWQNRIAFSQDDRVRPVFELACSYMACNLSAYSDIGAIRSDNLAVRSHPELENGLVVNTEFRNTAPFPQAFPIMVISFNSASNEIVALREFSPDEYLDPGLRDVSMMPSMSPVQVSLEIIDPGPGAVNYTLAFRLP
ncbi:MAG: DUF3426 domain-containing protein [Pseudomonadales bacterium]|nr:DUF3426 domain-containing protein [Pseudomonadales bacterium]